MKNGFYTEEHINWVVGGRRQIVVELWSIELLFENINNVSINCEVRDCHLCTKGQISTLILSYCKQSRLYKF